MLRRIMASLVLSALAPDLSAGGDAAFQLRCSRNSERSGGTTEMQQATTAGGDGLVVAVLEAEEVAEFVVASAEALR